MYREHDVVVLRHDIPEHGLIEGDVGAVVGVYRSGGYEVEFTAAEGDTVAVVTLADAEVRQMGRREILRVRELAPIAG